MKITNKQMLEFYSLFDRKYNNTDDIKLKWNISEIAKNIYEIKSRFETQKNELINKYGVESEDGVKSISLSDPKIQELFDCECEISPISLEDISKLNLTLEEMMILKPIIKA